MVKANHALSNSAQKDNKINVLITNWDFLAQFNIIGF